MAKATCRWLDDSGVVQRCDFAEFERTESAEWVWVDVTDPDQAIMEALAAPFGLHPLAVEDALHPQTRPKLDLYAEGPFFAWITPHIDERDELRFEELDIFLSPRGVVTAHEGSVEEIDEVASEGQHLFKRGPDWIVHGILDRLVDSMLPIADAVGDALESVEDSMLDEPSRFDLERLYVLRRRLLRLHRTVAPERDMVRSIARERDFVSEDAYRYFEDVGDHLLHVEESLDTYRDIGSAIMDIYLSAQSNRLNEIMKVLTVVTVVIGAATLISGIYGMNLLAGMWPRPDDPFGFAGAIALMVVVAGTMMIYFRKRDWW